MQNTWLLIAFSFLIGLADQNYEGFLNVWLIKQTGQCHVRRLKGGLALLVNWTCSRIWSGTGRFETGGRHCNVTRDAGATVLGLGVQLEAFCKC